MTEKEMDQRGAELVLAFDLIHKDAGPFQKGTPATGAVRCPRCGVEKGLHYARLGSNGHVRARCLTPNCVSFVQ